MTHRDALGKKLHVGQGVNCPDGQVAQIYALGHAASGESVVLVTLARSDVTRHLSSHVVAQRQVRR